MQALTSYSSPTFASKMLNDLKWACIVHVNAKEIPFEFHKREEEIPL